MTKHGFDVSYCQRTINWKALKNDPNAPNFIIPREGFLTTTDRQFDANVKGARENGFEIPGIYHFSYALSVDEAIEEAVYSVKDAKRVGLPTSTIIFFDFEYDSEDWCREKGVDPTPEFVQSLTKAFCDKVKELGYVPGVYTNVDYYERMYKKKLPEGVVVWAAKWSKKPPYFPYTFWQTSCTGSGFAGINGNVDTDVWECEDTPKEPDNKPEEKKTNEEIADEVIRGDWGNGGEREERLEAAGYDYYAIQAIVDEKLSESKPKTNEELANEVIRGDWGNGVERKERLEAAGYDYDAVQSIVNEKLYGE